MSFQEPSHGWWCNARTYPTRCRHCGAKVFYFSCNCGAKVFFESLGWPWPIHNCIDEIIRQIDFKIEEEYKERVAKRSRQKDFKVPIKAILPISGEFIENIGFVREMILKFNVFEKFSLPSDTPFALGLLGELGKSNFIQITIHVENLASDKIDSYTFLIDKNTWDDLGASRGDLLSFKLVGKSIPGRADYWFCDDIDWVSSH
jgi:hypothetical protein